MRSHTYISGFLVLLCVSFAFASPPLVLLHGFAANSSVLLPVVAIIKARYPDLYVRNLEIGDGKPDSVLMPLTAQANLVCSLLKDDPMLTSGFNLIGFSQGGLVNRGFLQRCNDPPVLTFITWVTPHAGVYGAPFVNFECHEYLGNATLCELLDTNIDKFIYTPLAQKSIAAANYWKDPYNLALYEQQSEYLADLENRAQQNATYRNNVMSVKNFVMVHSPIDEVVVPNNSTAFGFYAPNTIGEIVPLEQSAQYTQDWLGLRTLDEQGKLHIFNASVQHTDHTSASFQEAFEQIVLPFLA
eukprot:TRINITY_DN1298_c0_g1_i2.p1 TRINITY_DN1298_c0_g1~~TRINITY_DN1298_c0_g1_i2.p1  ORF type:complete len:300 (+),score=41.63 TRINITY_DN1298_c0_g1_i2:104-1003(+)